VARVQLHNAERIAVEIRPEGILLRPESDSEEIHGDSLQDELPEESNGRRWFKFGRKKSKA
jgi:hypothetical protein